jgi:type II secretory pathway pseudopilin PulG
MTAERNGKFNRLLRNNKYRKTERGATRLEVLVATIIFGILGAVLLEESLRYQEYAEKTAMEITVRHMRSGLQLRIADLMMRDKMEEIDSVLNDNPVSWLETPPPNYLGALQNPDPQKLAQGNWYFDAGAQELVYLPYHRRYFNPGPTGQYAVRFRVTAMQRPHPKNNDASSKIEGVSLSLLSQYKYKWNWPIE